MVLVRYHTMPEGPKGILSQRGKNTNGPVKMQTDASGKLVVTASKKDLGGGRDVSIKDMEGVLNWDINPFNTKPGWS